MLTDNSQPEKPTPAEVPQPEPEPQLPEVPKLSLEDVKALIAANHDTTVSNDDPILMVVTIMNGFLESLQKLLDRHNEAVTGIMAEKTQTYVDTVKAASEEFSRLISEASVTAIMEIFEKYNQNLNKFKKDIFWLGAIITCTAIGNLIGLAILK